ncbi:MAG: 23S rRNA (uracil(1939)-C(5))-methyltransferase RlmD [Tissierellia bacterium]|nr:23S rRNA (uracil(1939)-C(5))-methyltransferase RlmD [Tissierellia bacterium]
MAKKKRILEVKIQEVDYPNKGRAVAEDGRPIEIKGGLPGQLVELKITKQGKEKIRGKIRKVLEPSPLEGESPCPHIQECGGCAYQSLTEEEELSLKQKQLEKLFDGVISIDIPISSGSSPFGYRNKMEYTFGDEEKGGPLTLGLHKKGKFHEILPTTHCQIVHSDFLVLRQGVEDYFQEKGIPFYRRMVHQGVLRHFVIRRSLRTKEILCNLVTSSQGEIDTKEFMDYILKLPLEGKITSLWHTINDSLGDVITPEKVKLLYGQESIVERLCGLEFTIGPFSFFQTNTKSAEVLYEKARNLLQGEYGQIFDLYSGTGTIAQILAPMAKKVVGIEINEEAVESAKATAMKNKLNNVEFICGDVLKEVENLKGHADAIVLDPPREGINPKALKKIIAFNPKTFLYISCNPRSLANELPEFIKEGYRIKHIEALDQFPRTRHVETVALLSKLDSDEHINIEVNEKVNVFHARNL